MARTDHATYSDEQVFKILKSHPLPPRARVRLLNMRSKRAASEAAADGFWNHQQALMKKLAGEKDKLRRAAPEDREFHIERVAEIENQISELKKSRDTAGAISSDFADEMTRQAVRLARSGAPMKDYDPDLPPQDEAGDVKLLEEQRAETGGFRKEINSFEHAVGDPAEIMRRLQRDFDNFAAAGKPDFQAFIHEERQEDGSYRPFGPVRWPKSYAGADNFVPDAFHFVFWLFRDEAKKKIESEIVKLTAGKKLVPLAQRPALIKKLETKILIAERIDAALVWRLQEAGRTDIQHSTTNAKAYLGIKVGKVAR